MFNRGYSFSAEISKIIIESVTESKVSDNEPRKSVSISRALERMLTSMCWSVKSSFSCGKMSTDLYGAALAECQIVAKEQEHEEAELHEPMNNELTE